MAGPTPSTGVDQPIVRSPERFDDRAPEARSL